MEVAKNFDEFKKYLDELIEINKDNINIKDLTFQFRKINSTINELKKNDITVPNELIKLKLSLSNQIDQAKESASIRKELIKFLELAVLQLKETPSKKPVKKVKSKKIIIRERVNLIDLINASIVPAHTELYAYYKKRRFSATLLPDGSIEMKENKRKKNFKSHRAAAIAITGYQVDSWGFWNLDFEGKPLTLDDYRNKYFKRKSKDEE